LEIQRFRRSAVATRLRRLLAFPAAWLAAGALACSSLPPPRREPPALAVHGGPAAPVPADASQSELRLTLAAGTYVRLAIVPAPAPLVVRELGPDGATVEELQIPGGGDRPHPLSWVTRAAGEHRWIVAPRAGGGPPVVSAVALDEQRPAGACDDARLRAERAVLGARRELDRADAGAPARARGLLEPAAAAAAEVGERQGVLALQLAAARAAEPSGAEDGAGRYRRALDLAGELGDVRAQAAALEGSAQLLSGERQLEALRAALALRRRSGEESDEARLLEQLGTYLRRSGETTPAIESQRQAAALRRRNGLGPGTTYCELAQLHYNQGDLVRARGYLDVGLESSAASGDPAGQACALMENARIDLDLGELQTAYDESERAYELMAPRGVSADSIWALQFMATIRVYLGEPEKARQRYAEVLSDFEALHDPSGRAWTLLGIGSTYEVEHQAAKALASYQQAMELIRASGLHSVEALALYDLGRAHRELGQAAEAVAELERALALTAAQGPVRQAQILVELANAYRQSGALAAADAAFQRAIRLSGTAPVFQAAALAGLARLDRDRGDLAAARSAIEEALAATEKVRAGVLRPDQRVSFLAARRAYYELDVDLLMRLEQGHPGAGHDAEALLASERARARGLLDLLAKERVDVRRGIPPELKRRETEIGERIARLQSRLWSSQRALPAEEIGRLARDLDQAEEGEKELEADLRRRQPGYAVVRAPQPLPLADIQRLLDEETALLEFFVGDESSSLFVVTRQGLAVHALPPREELDRLVERHRSEVGQDSRLRARAYAEDAYRLYRLLLLPAAGELRGKRRLIVAPDGPLYSLSFEALLTGAVADAGGSRRDLPYLLRERSLSYVPSASVLAQLLDARRRGGEAERRGPLFVGFGDPAAAPDPGGMPAAGPARPLPAARDEVRRIAGLFPPDRAVAFLGAEASEENVKASPLVSSARNLHFAVHGLLDESSPERSGLQLARREGSAEDGRLQVREVFNLELHAELVVLSACKTGLGKEISGEGLIGMTRAFLYAGAASIVVSLWPVDDESTADLMVSFYRHLQETGDRSEALRRAKLELIDGSRYFHPYYWAPFILVGRPQ
jgi:CHAT domain-containing protein